MPLVVETMTVSVWFTYLSVSLQEVYLHVQQEHIERERKEREKQKKKDKIQRQKEQGTYLTAKQKEDRRRAQQMLEALGQKGMHLYA